MARMSGEFELIDVISKSLSPLSARTLKGIGDDAAVIAPDQLLCSDCLVENIHFDLKLTRPEDIGWKAVAVCLSDIAAMNGRPTAVVISLALPEANEKFIASFYRGVEKLRSLINFDVVGGDLSRSPGPIFIDVAALGTSTKPIYRSGAREGDVLAVSGTPGASAAGLYSMQNWSLIREIQGALMNAHQLPKPRFDLDVSSATSLIDISDGLASEAHHIAKASRVRIEIDEARIPLHERAVALAKRTKQSALDWALYGGEDYELLATFPPEQKLPEGFTAIGRITGEGSPQSEITPVTFVQTDGTRVALMPRGFNHFSSPPNLSKT